MFQTGRCIWAPHRNQDPCVPCSLATLRLDTQRQVKEKTAAEMSNVQASQQKIRALGEKEALMRLRRWQRRSAGVSWLRWLSGELTTDSHHPTLLCVIVCCFYIQMCFLLGADHQFPVTQWKMFSLILGWIRLFLHSLSHVLLRLSPSSVHQVLIYYWCKSQIKTMLSKYFSEVVTGQRKNAKCWYQKSPDATGKCAVKALSLVVWNWVSVLQWTFDNTCED